MTDQVELTEREKRRQRLREVAVATHGKLLKDGKSYADVRVIGDRLIVRVVRVNPLTE